MYIYADMCIWVCSCKNVCIYAFLCIQILALYHLMYTAYAKRLLILFSPDRYFHNDPDCLLSLFAAVTRKLPRGRIIKFLSFFYPKLMTIGEGRNNID